MTNFMFSKYFPSTETSEDQSKSDETKEEEQKEQAMSETKIETQKGQAIPEDKVEDAKQTQGDDAMIDDIKSELEVEAEDVGKSEEKGSELADVPTTEPGEHGLPEAKKLKTSDS
jgi:hypothetical protein